MPSDANPYSNPMMLRDADRNYSADTASDADPSAKPDRHTAQQAYAHAYTNRYGESNAHGNGYADLAPHQTTEVVIGDDRLFDSFGMRSDLGRLVLVRHGLGVPSPSERSAFL